MKLYDISGEQFSAMDAPRHLMTEEGTAQTTLDRSLGICQVAELEGKVTREMLEEVMEEDCERLLIRGDAQITRDGADYLAEKKLVLLGVEQETPVRRPDPRGSDRKLENALYESENAM